MAASMQISNLNNYPWKKAQVINTAEHFVTSWVLNLDSNVLKLYKSIARNRLKCTKLRLFVSHLPQCRIYASLNRISLSSDNGSIGLLPILRQAII